MKPRIWIAIIISFILFIAIATILSYFIVHILFKAPLLYAIIVVLLETIAFIRGTIYTLKMYRRRK
jgi:hypothetical protein